MALKRAFTISPSDDVRQVLLRLRVIGGGSGEADTDLLAVEQSKLGTPALSFRAQEPLRITSASALVTALLDNR